tara:strand:- start:9164 stop:9268 length:105 start_codon:yes stop_codon:yes gene_type:complete
MEENKQLVDDEQVAKRKREDNLNQASAPKPPQKT